MSAPLRLILHDHPMTPDGADHLENGMNFPALRHHVRWQDYLADYE
jgi:hypothetical protein